MPRLPFDLRDSGVRCKNCGKLIDGMGVNWADPSLPDPLTITCPYCRREATYPKTSIQSDLALRNASPRSLFFYLIAIVALGIIIAGIKFHMR